MKSKQTSNRITKVAIKTLKDRLTSIQTKRLAGSALSQSNTKKVTSPKIVKLASKTLRDKLASIQTKKLAGSDLSQAESKKKKIIYN